MGNDKSGPVGHKIIEGVLYHLLTLCVKSAGSFVENKNWGILEYGPRYAEPLTLPSRTADAPVANVSPVAVRHLHDKIVGKSGSGCRLYLGVSGIGLAAFDVIGYGIVKKNCFLVNQSDLPHQIDMADHSHINFINEHCPFCNIIESRNE